MKVIKQNMGVIVIIVLALVLSYFTSFTLTAEETIFERSGGLFVSLLGLIIASYAIYISFINKLKNIVGDSGVLNLLNYYFLITIGLLFVTNAIYIVLPSMGSIDLFGYRFLYYLTIGFTLLVIWYLFLSARHFIKK